VPTSGCVLKLSEEPIEIKGFFGKEAGCFSLVDLSGLCAAFDGWKKQWVSRTLVLELAACRGDELGDPGW